MVVAAGAVPRRWRIGRTAGRISRHESRRVGSPPLVGRGGGGGRAVGARRSAFFLAATPSPTLPRKGGGSAPCLWLRALQKCCRSVGPAGPRSSFEGQTPDPRGKPDGECAKDHPVPLVRQGGRGGGEVLRLDLQEFEGR